MSLEYEAAERGATLLDERKPGWYNLIDETTLNMWSMRLCVLGQVYGDYDVGKLALGITCGDNFGFAIAGSYQALHASWLVLICDRLKAEVEQLVSQVSLELTAP